MLSSASACSAIVAVKSWASGVCSSIHQPEDDHDGTRVSQMSERGYNQIFLIINVYYGAEVKRLRSEVVPTTNRANAAIFVLAEGR